MSETVHEGTQKSIREYVREALAQDREQESAFPPGDDKFLRVAHYVANSTQIGSYDILYNEIYRISFSKLGANYAQTYPLGQFSGNLNALKGLVSQWQASEVENSRSGYPFAPAGSGSGCSHRLYLNPDPSHAIAVYSYFLGSAKTARWGAAINWSKMGDYGIVTTYRDVIVIYLLGRDVLDELAAALLEYQQNNDGHFLDEIPVMTASLPGLRGVGYAEDLTFMRDGGPPLAYWRNQDEDWQNTHNWPGENDGLFFLSHSQWRSLFVMAALRMTGGGDMDSLRANLAKIAAAAGLTSATMHQKPDISENLVGLLADVLFQKT